MFRATVDLLYEKLEAGEKAGDPFDMLLALELAKALYKRAKGGELGQAQTSLGNCHQIIGQFRPGRKHLDLAAELFTAAAKLEIGQQRLGHVELAVDRKDAQCRNPPPTP